MIFDVENWHFLTPPHYTNSQNSIISFGYGDFLGKNLSNFAPLPWKLHNRYCHNWGFDAILHWTFLAPLWVLDVLQDRYQGNVICHMHFLGTKTGMK